MKIIETLSMEEALKALNAINESIDPSNALNARRVSDADVIFYGYVRKNDKPVIIDPPEELSEAEFEIRKDAIIKGYNKYNLDDPKGNRYSYERDFMFYALYKK